MSRVRALLIGVAVSADLPGPGAVVGQIRPYRLRLRRLRRPPGDPAHHIRRQQVLGRQAMLVGKRRDHRPHRREAASGHRVAFRPAVRGRRALGQRGCGPGQIRLRLEAGAVHRALPVGGVPAGAPAPEAGQLGQVMLGPWHGPGGLHDRRVGQHPAGGQVPPAGDLVPLQPELADDGQAAARVHPVDAGRAAPGVRPGRRRLRREHRRELLPRPLGLALLGEFGRERVSQLDQDLHVQGGVPEPVGRAMGGSTSPPPRGPSPASSPSTVSTSAPSPTRG